MKRLILPVVMGVLYLCAMTAEAQPHLTFIQGSNYTRSIRGMDDGYPQWDPITEPNPQGDGSYLVGDWESGNDTYLDVMAIQWNLPASLGEGAYIDSVRLTIQYHNYQSLTLSVRFYNADYEILSRNRNDLFLDIALTREPEILQGSGTYKQRIHNDLNGSEGTFF